MRDEVLHTFDDHFLLPQDFDLAERTPVSRPTTEEVDSLQNTDLFEGKFLLIRKYNRFSGDILGIPSDEITKDQPNFMPISHSRQAHRYPMQRLYDSPDTKKDDAIFGKPVRDIL